MEKVSVLLKQNVSAVASLERDYAKALKQIERLTAQVNKLKAKLGMPVEKEVKKEVKKPVAKVKKEVAKKPKAPVTEKAEKTEKKKVAKKIEGGAKKKKASIL